MLGSLKNIFKWQNARIAAITLLVTVLLFFLFVWRLGTLTPGLSAAEVSARQSSSSLSRIMNDPINAPHKTIQLFFQKIGKKGAFWMRSASVIFTVASIFAFYFIARWWFGKFIAMLGMIMFATTPWVITLARHATPDITLLSPIFIILAYVWLSRAESKKIFPAMLLGAAVAISVYTPGVFWFVLVSAIFSLRSLLVFVKTLDKRTLFASSVLVLLLISPLVYSIVKNPSLIRDIALIPTDLPGAVDAIKSLGWNISALIFKTREHLSFAVGHLPVLTIVQIALTFIGAYAMADKAKKIMPTMISLIVLGIILATINNNTQLLLLTIPAFTILTSLGLRHMQLKWTKVFPQNPLPKALAIILMSFVILSHTVYGVRYGLIAWPHLSDTDKTYVLK